MTDPDLIDKRRAARVSAEAILDEPLFVVRLTSPEDGTQYIARHSEGEGPATYRVREHAERYARIMARVGWLVDVRLADVSVALVAP